MRSDEQVRNGGEASASTNDEQISNAECVNEQANENVSKVVNLQKDEQPSENLSEVLNLQKDENLNENVSKVVNLQNDENLNENVSKVVNLQKDEQGEAKKEQGGVEGAGSSDCFDSSLPAHSQEDERSIALLEAELAKEREARALCENRLLCMSLLDEAGLPRELGDYLATNDADETEKRVKCVAQIIKNAVNEAVRARLETIKTPARGRGELTRQEFKELSLADMQRLYATDKELYRALTGKNN